MMQDAIFNKMGELKSRRIKNPLTHNNMDSGFLIYN